MDSCRLEAEEPDNGGLGHGLVIRPVRPADGPALVAFHNGLSLESTRLRFFSPHPRLTAREVERFTHVDHDRREALVVLDGDSIVAVGRFDRVPARRDAEVAFVVAEDYRQHGLASTLLRRLARLAADRGVDRLTAETLFENHSMLDVFAASGFPLERHIELGVAWCTMDITGLHRSPEITPG